MGESFKSVRVLFSEPETYSTFVAAYKTEQVEESYEPQSKPKADDPVDAGGGDAKDDKEDKEKDDNALLTDDGIGARAGLGTTKLTGGDNLVALGTNVADDGGGLYLTDGVGNETIQIGEGLASNGGAAELDMERDGDHVVTIGAYVASDGGTFTYLDGHDKDHLTIGENAGMAGGTVELNMDWAGDNRVLIGANAAQTGTLVYWGSVDAEDLTFGNNLASGGTANIRLGNDTSVDVVRFSGSVGGSGGAVQICGWHRLHLMGRVIRLSPL